MPDPDLQWKVWYVDNDGTPYFVDNRTHEYTDVPGRGVQVVTIVDESVGIKPVARCDFYLMVNGEWLGVDYFGMLDYIIDVLGLVKSGRMIQKDEFKKIWQMAITDPEMPRKNARYPEEPIVDGA